MKRLLFTTMIAACAAMGVSGCMSGDYDANPDGTASGTNPLNPPGSGGGGGTGGPGTAAKGEIRFTLNGTNTTYSGAGINYIEVGSGIRLIAGGKIDATADYTLNLRIDGYTGPQTYPISITSSEGVYTIQPFGGPENEYSTATGSPAGSGEIKVTSDAGNEMIGTFSFTAYNATGDKVTFTNGSFDVVKF